MTTVVGLLHPGAMGSRVGAALVDRGVPVMWASSGRSAATADRAASGRFDDVGTVASMIERCDVIVSICPPQAAREVATAASGFHGLYLDANAVAPSTARQIQAIIESGGGRYVDGGIVGSGSKAIRLFLSGREATVVEKLFSGSGVETRVISDDPTSASALKICSVAWAQGTATLLLNIRALAISTGVDEVLLEQWRETQPTFEDESWKVAQRALEQGWRRTGEMKEIALSFRSADLPPGFFEGAHAIYAAVERDEQADVSEASFDRVISSLLTRSPVEP